MSRIPENRVRTTVESAVGSGWLKARPLSDSTLVNLLAVDLHVGEAEAITLALEIRADRVLIDERDGRVLARQLGLNVTGVLGILLRGKRMGRVKLIQPEIAALRLRARFFVAPTLEAEILAKAGE